MGTGTRLWTRAALAAALCAMPALAYKLAPQGRAVAVAKSALSVTPAIDWNRMNRRPGRNAESWTLDGMPLNELTFYGGITDNQALFNEVDKRDKPLPRFSANMLAPDVVQLFESSYRLAGGTALFTVDSVAPATFAGQPGFRFAYTFTQQSDEVTRKGEATGTIVGGRLYLVTYEAPALHYFARNMADYRAVVASARLGAG